MPVKLMVALFLVFAVFVTVGIVGIVYATQDDGGGDPYGCGDVPAGSGCQ